MTFTPGEHRNAYMKAPRLVVVKPHGKYIHETLHRASEFPRGTTFRTQRVNGHKLIVGYWGRVAHGKHEFFAVSTVLHPVGEKGCRFKKRLDHMGVKLTPGKTVIVNGVPPLTSKTGRRIISPLRVFK